MKLTSAHVEQVFLDCLFKEDEDSSKHIRVESILITVGFHPERLAGHKEDIQTMLQCLPDQFHQLKGGGWSFLNACYDKDGHQWTGEHQRMEQLFTLGIASKLAKWLMPRELWSALPGSVPYVEVMV